MNVLIYARINYDQLYDVNDASLGMDVLKNEVNRIKWNPNKKDWLETGCCYLDKFKGCFETAMEPYCGPDGKKYLKWCADSYYADFMDMACPSNLSFNGSKCKLLARKHAKILKSNEAARKDPEPHSVFVPLYRLLLDFGDIGQDFFKVAINHQADNPSVTPV